jgi:collagen triple helix repeat protein
MPSKKGVRGERGIPGPPGPAGPAGKQGATGQQGATGVTGQRGATGATGQRGATGARGAQGPNGAVGSPEGTLGGRSRIKLIADVDQHITRIYHELDVQMKRTAQIQVELDDLRAKVRRLMGSST